MLKMNIRKAQKASWISNGSVGKKKNVNDIRVNESKPYGSNFP